MDIPGHKCIVDEVPNRDKAIATLERELTFTEHFDHSVQR